jgi:ubiquinone/menaquinone biosynthesis C-methylase UbiE
MGGEAADFLLGHPEGELESFGVLSRAFQDFTLQVFVEAGLKQGMHVLEIGSGGGDLALLAAEFVGPTGSVLGIESSERAVTYAKHRADASGLHNINFIEARIDHDLPFEPQFDALVGRIVLMFLPSPETVVRRLAEHVRPGGLVIFQEPDMSWAKSVPNVPAVEKAAGWMRRVFEAAGADSVIGPKLHSIFKKAGLPDPVMRVDGLIYGSKGDGPKLLADTIQAILPAIDQLGIANASEIDIATFEARIRRELEDANATMSSPLLISARSQIPG